ncbi:MAG TPA: hypothetical protein VGM60_09040 [Pseudonocardia sp.]|jgi:hypothetical protein|uniref:hypothetical protein n=1 Tax=Pseudonocardia sp. TaxID=60912 RepID=UPI002F4141A4
MTSDNPVADRLLSDARKKTARVENGPLGTAALIIGLLALASCGLIPGVGWALGAVGVAVSIVGMLRPGSAMLSRIGLGTSIVALIGATFFFLKSTGRI